MTVPSADDVAAANSILGYDPFEDGELHCDYCSTVEHAEDLTADWNGETGNHLTCEWTNSQMQAKYGSSSTTMQCDDCGWTNGQHDLTVEH